MEGGARAALVCLIAVAWGLVLGCGDDGGEDRPDGGGATSDSAVDAPAGCGTDQEPAGLSWEDCHDGARCATVAVPLDHAAPDGASVETRILRSPASCAAERIGVVVVPSSGPGSGPVGVLGPRLALLSALIPEVTRRFDIVLVDARGTGESGAIDCVEGAHRDALRGLDLAPEEDAEWAALSAHFQVLAEGCRERAGAELLRHVDSESAARDLELIREALGEERLSLIGVTEGALIGAVYATLFPDRVRAFVFDSPPDPTLATVIDVLEVEGRGFDEKLERFFETCGADPECAFHGGEGADAVGAAFDALLASLDEGGGTALAVADGRTVSATDLRLAGFRTVRDTDWRALAGALVTAEAGDGTALAAEADDLLGRADEGAYPAGGWWEGGIAIGIADFPCPAAFDGAAARARLSALVAESPRIAPVFVASRAFACADWPVATEPLPTVSAPTAPPVLIACSDRDATSPRASCEAMGAALGNGSHFLWYEGFGHSVYDRSSCVLEVASAFLLDPDTPPARASCPGE